jgi:hypothetical protein
MAVTRYQFRLSVYLPALCLSLALCLAALRIRRELLDLCRHYFGPHGVAANHESARIDGKMDVWKPGSREDGCLEALVDAAARRSRCWFQGKAAARTAFV